MKIDNSPESVLNTLAHRLATQQGGKGKIQRQFFRRLAKQGKITLPSGFGVGAPCTAQFIGILGARHNFSSYPK